ncbi:MAG: hypothetical protein Q9164_003282 [Protoblastenia rupestris]
MSNSSTATSSRSASPVPSLTGRKSLHQSMLRSQTSPLPPRPPSTDLAIAQDSAFPVFPVTKSRTASPTTPSDTKMSSPSSQGHQLGQTEPSSGRLPASLGKFGAGGLLQRMNSIAPGPFKIKENSNRDPQVPGHGQGQLMSVSKDPIRPTSSGSVKAHAPRLSASSSVYTRTRSTSTVSGISRFGSDAPEVPAVPSIPKESEQTPHSQSDYMKHGRKNTFDFGPLSLTFRPQSPPQDDKRTPSSDEQESPQREVPETMKASHKPKPSVAAAAMQPLHEIGSVSSFKPSRSIKRRKASQGANQPPLRAGENTDGSDDIKLEDPPPVPASFRRAYHDEPSPFHTPHESTSSNGSYSSGARSGSSRSSPPQQESPHRRGQESSDSVRIDNMFHDFQFGVENKPPFEERPSNQEPPPQEPKTHTSQRYARAPPASAQPTIPNIQPRTFPLRQNSTPLTSPEDYLTSSETQSSNIHLLPAPRLSPPAPLSPGRRTPRIQAPDKGPCRGCGELIKGKSVSSADGRLTGRYHKGCFVCKTCNSPFQTTDFYVIMNHPYCARHYHELNNSLCQGCDRGIEGQYLETESRRKFHSYCFTCQECHRLLRDDYYEWNGKTLCESHAFKAAQQPSSSLGMSGRRFPERRTTKLMMMM